jgi:uncharacterized protein (TIGR01244 family)
MSTELPITPIAADVCAAPQLDAGAMAAAAAAGFRSVINNRPDGEGGPDQPTSAEIEAAARAAGLEYRYLPVEPSWHSAEQVAATAAMLDELPRPILMFCRSGGRSARLYMAATGG